VTDSSPEDLRRFASRPFGAAEANKRAYLAQQYRRDPAAHFRSVCDLAEHLRAVLPDWPSPALVEKDLVELIAWKALLDRAKSISVR